MPNFSAVCTVRAAVAQLVKENNVFRLVPFIVSSTGITIWAPTATSAA